MPKVKWFNINIRDLHNIIVISKNYLNIPNMCQILINMKSFFYLDFHLSELVTLLFYM